MPTQISADKFASKLTEVRIELVRNRDKAAVIPINIAGKGLSHNRSQLEMLAGFIKVKKDRKFSLNLGATPLNFETWMILSHLADHLTELTFEYELTTSQYQKASEYLPKVRFQGRASANDLKYTAEGGSLVTGSSYTKFDENNLVSACDDEHKSTNDILLEKLSTIVNKFKEMESHNKPIVSKLGGLIEAYNAIIMKAKQIIKTTPEFKRVAKMNMNRDLEEWKTNSLPIFGKIYNKLVGLKCGTPLTVSCTNLARQIQKIQKSIKADMTTLNTYQKLITSSEIFKKPNLEEPLSIREKAKLYSHLLVILDALIVEKHNYDSRPFGTGSLVAQENLQALLLMHEIKGIISLPVLNAITEIINPTSYIKTAQNPTQDSKLYTSFSLSNVNKIFLATIRNMVEAPFNTTHQKVLKSMLFLLMKQNQSYSLLEKKQVHDISFFMKNYKDIYFHLSEMLLHAESLNIEIQTEEQDVKPLSAKDTANISVYLQSISEGSVEVAKLFQEIKKQFDCLYSNIALKHTVNQFIGSADGMSLTEALLQVGLHQSLPKDLKQVDGETEKPSDVKTVAL